MSYDDTTERDIKISDMHANGMTYAEISTVYGISRQRCHQIDEAVKKSRMRASGGLYIKVLEAADKVGTSHAARAYNAIVRHGMDELEFSWDDIVGVHAVGMVTAAVIATALGVTIPDDVMRELRDSGYMKDTVDSNDEM